MGGQAAQQKGFSPKTISEGNKMVFSHLIYFCSNRGFYLFTLAKRIYKTLPQHLSVPPLVFASKSFRSNVHARNLLLLASQVDAHSIHFQGASQSPSQQQHDQCLDFFLLSSARRFVAGSYFTNYSVDYPYQYLCAIATAHLNDIQQHYQSFGNRDLPEKFL